MNETNFEDIRLKKCSAKDCNIEAEWEHEGLKIFLCELCFNQIDFQDNFKPYGRNRLNDLGKRK